MLICGVDDAGRGPVLGSLVVAGVLFRNKDLDIIEDLGVKDSKTISPKRRMQLVTEILEIAKNHHVVKSSPAEIDKVVETGGRLHRLNRLEARAMAEVIRYLKPNVAYVDASDVLPERFKQHIAEEVPFNVKIVSEHKADKTYPVVSAASIIAKVERDKEITMLGRKYGDLGSGYTTDPKTVSFLEKWVKANGSYPEFVRKSWKTAKRIKAKHDSFQRSLL